MFTYIVHITYIVFTVVVMCDIGTPINKCETVLCNLFSLVFSDIPVQPRIDGKTVGGNGRNRTRQVNRTRSNDRPYVCTNIIK